MPKGIKQDQLRTSIAVEAARILAGDPLLDFSAARRKAAQRIGCTDKRRYPDNLEISQALAEYQRLFKRDTQPGALGELMRTALEVMEWFERFAPRIVGPVFEGTADSGSRITIHLHADSPEEIMVDLIQRGISWEESERLFDYGHGKAERRSVYLVYAGETAIELVSLPLDDRRSPPLDTLTRRPQRGASIKQFKRLLEEARLPG